MLTKHEKQAFEVINFLKKKLKNPDSLIVNSIYKDSSLDHYAIDYSSQNGFGGNTRDMFYMDFNDNNLSEDDYFIQDYMKQLWYIVSASNAISLDVNRVMAAFEDPSLAE